MFEGYKLLHIWAQRLSHYSIAYKGIVRHHRASTFILNADIFSFCINVYAHTSFSNTSYIIYRCFIK